MDVILPFHIFSLQGLLVEESSEIASARASSIYRKSFCRRSNKNMNVNKCKKQTSLSKISEEDSENIFTRSDNQHICDDNSIKKVDDKEKIYIEAKLTVRE